MAISLINPVPGGVYTDGYGPRGGFTKNGVYVPPMLHDGQDIAADLGTPLYAAHDGTVIWADWSKAGGGWGVQIQHPEGWSTLYFHMLEDGRPAEGTKVQQGKTRIGSVGSSGLAVGPHTHLMLRVNGADIDPLPYISGAPTPNEGDDEMTPEEKQMLKDIHHTLTSGKAGVKEQGEVNRLLYAIKKGVDQLVDAITPGKAGVRNAGAIVGPLYAIRTAVEKLAKK